MKNRKPEGRDSGKNDRFKRREKPGERPRGKSFRNTIKPGLKQGENETETMRLNRFIANSGVCSRREADDLIQKGLVSVNGKVVSDMGTKVSFNDEVKYKGKRLSSEQKVYILMNKPKGYVTTVEDPHADKTVMDLIGDECSQRVYPVGRLDKETTGVLLLTNDGDLTGRLTHPRYNRKKIYHVFLDKNVEKNDLLRLAEGIELDGELIAADAVSYAEPDDKSQIGIELHSGKNRVIRRLFEVLGYKVKKLDRVYFAGLTKKNVQRGRWRYLNDKEISMIKRGSY